MTTTPVQKIVGWIPILVAVIGVTIAIFFVLRPTSNGAGLVGKPAPNFTLKSTTGKTVQLASLRGHPVVLNFWGVSCPPCRREAPLLQAASQKYQSSGLIVLGLDAQGDTAETIQAFARERNLTYPMLLQAMDLGADHYGVKELPFTLFVDRQGIVRSSSPAPFIDNAPLEQALRTIL